MSNRKKAKQIIKSWKKGNKEEQLFYVYLKDLGLPKLISQSNRDIYDLDGDYYTTVLDYHFHFDKNRVIENDTNFPILLTFTKDEGTTYLTAPDFEINFTLYDVAGFLKSPFHRTNIACVDSLYNYCWHPYTDIINNELKEAPILIALEDLKILDFKEDVGIMANILDESKICEREYIIKNLVAKANKNYEEEMKPIKEFYELMGYNSDPITKVEEEPQIFTEKQAKVYRKTILEKVQ